jgi:hypothetical protein
MSDERKRESKLTVSHEFSVLQPRPQNAYLIAETDWKRIKRIVKEIVPHKDLYQWVSSFSAGVSVSSAFALLSFKLSSSSPPSWAWTVVSSAFVGSATATAAFFYFNLQQRRTTVRSVEGVLVEITEIEENLAPASLPETQSIKAPGTNTGLTICSALYGADGNWKDVTSLLAAKIQGGRLRVPATNQELGGDPAPNVWKTLRVVYLQGGIEYSKILREDEILSLPED